MNYNRAETITKYLNLSINNDWDFSTLRKKMKEDLYRLDDEEFSLVLNYVDDKRREYDTIKSDRLMGISSILFGFALILGGIIVTVGTYQGWFGESSYYIILYGPIIGGVSAIGYGFTKKNSYDRFMSANEVRLNQK